MKKLVYAVFAASLALPVLAQTQTPGVDRREANQERRIDQGVASGELTARESTRLDKGQRRVERMEAQAKADGVVTQQERAQLHRAQDKQSARIYHEKHDRQHDFNHDGRKDRRR